MKILIVDDSAVFRSQIRQAIDGQGGIQVVDAALNGRDAIAKLSAGLEVDLITLDMEMPEMDGMATLKELQKLGIKKRVLVFSAKTPKGADLAIEALKNGASDIVPKPTSSGDIQEAIRGELLPRIFQFKSSEPVAKKTETNQHKNQVDLDMFTPKLVLIGSSTGGPAALEEVLSKMEAPLKAPILIAQHMPPVFTKTLADRIQKISGIEAVEATNGMSLENKIYVAPGDYHMELKKTGEGYCLALNQGPLVNQVRPAVDVLFNSVVEVFPEKVMAFILTGMGADGKDSCALLKEKKAGVMIQNEESCVVFGMPRAVYLDGNYDKMGDLHEISDVLKKMVN